MDTNRIIIGDNLAIMRGMPNDSIDLIATDPPYATETDWQGKGASAGFGFSDKWGGDIAPYLAFMGERLEEMHRLLTPEGAIWVQCDDAAQAYLTVLMDGIFGRRNRLASIVWRRTTGDQPTARNFGRVVDYLLYYGKSGKTQTNRVPVPTAVEYPHTDEYGAYKWASMYYSARTAGRESRHITFGGFTPADLGEDVGWRVPMNGDYARWIAANMIPDYASMSLEERLYALDAAGMVSFTSTGKPKIKRYQAANGGKQPSNLWVDIKPPAASERIGYPTQKPVALYERIIRASSDEGDTVLDPFAGSGTTLVAAHRLGRKWIGIDAEPVADIIAQRME